MAYTKNVELNSTVNKVTKKKKKKKKKIFSQILPCPYFPCIKPKAGAELPPEARGFSQKKIKKFTPKFFNFFSFGPPKLVFFNLAPQILAPPLPTGNQI